MPGVSGTPAAVPLHQRSPRRAIPPPGQVERPDSWPRNRDPGGPRRQGESQRGLQRQSLAAKLCLLPRRPHAAAGESEAERHRLLPLRGAAGTGGR